MLCGRGPVPQSSELEHRGQGGGEPAVKIWPSFLLSRAVGGGSAWTGVVVQGGCQVPPGGHPFADASRWVWDQRQALVPEEKHPRVGSQTDHLAQGGAGMSTRAGGRREEEIEI